MLIVRNNAGLVHALLMALCLSLTACGDSSDDDSQSASVNEVDDTNTEVDNGEPEGDDEVAESCVPGWMEAPHLVGSIHEHSGYSDGAIGTTPVDYFNAGREQGLDFMLSSDHSDNLRLPLTADTDCVSPELPECIQLSTPEHPLLGVTKWEATADHAFAATDESFTAIRGFEWTSDRFGHINVFFSERELNAKTTDGYALSMEGFWFWFAFDPLLGGGSDGLLVFNHPGREDAIHAFFPDPAYAFNGFEFRAEAGERAVGIEVFGKSSDVYDIDNNAPAEGWYAFALDKGWRLGPIGAEDEHGQEWAKPERAKTIFIAADKHPATLRQTMLDRRMYAVAQHHNAIRLLFSADFEPMGSEYSPPAGTMVQLNGEVSESMPAGGSLEIVSNHGEVITRATGSEVAFQVDVTDSRRWYFLRVLDADGIPVAYSSPIWLQAGEDSAECL